MELHKSIRCSTTFLILFLYFSIFFTSTNSSTEFNADNCDFFSFYYLGPCLSENPVDVVIVLDSSSQVDDTEYSTLKMWLITLFTQPMLDTMRIAVVQYGDDYQVEWNLGDVQPVHYSTRTSIINRMGGESCAGCAVTHVINNMFTNPDADKIMVIVSGSNPKDSPGACLSYGDVKTVLFSIGTKSNDNINELSCLVDPEIGYNDIYRLSHYNDLMGLRYPLLDGYVCDQPPYSGNYRGTQNFWNSQRVFEDIDTGKMVGGTLLKSRMMYYDLGYDRWTVLVNEDGPSKMYSTINGLSEALIVEYSNWGLVEIYTNQILGNELMRRECHLTDFPTRQPTWSLPPTLNPTTSLPTEAPTFSEPTKFPTLPHPSFSPSCDPTQSPTPTNPSPNPTTNPTTSEPTLSPSKPPTTTKPTHSPTTKPTSSEPTVTPTPRPTLKPTTSRPTQGPTIQPSDEPNRFPTESPFSFPSIAPTGPTYFPTLAPNMSEPWYFLCPNLVVTHNGDCEQSTMDVVFLLDTSNQMSSSDYVELQLFMIDFTNQVLAKKGPRMGVVQFSDYLLQEYNLGDYEHYEWFSILRLINFEGGETSDLNAAMRHAVDDMFIRSIVTDTLIPKREKVLILITSDDDNNACDMAEELDDLDIRLITVAVGTPQTFNCLNPEYVYLEDYTSLREIGVPIIEDTLCLEPNFPFGGIYSRQPGFYDDRPWFQEPSSVNLLYLDEVWLMQDEDPVDGTSKIGTLVARTGSGWKPADMVDWDYVDINYRYAKIEALRVYCMESWSPTSTPTRTPSGGPSVMPTNMPSGLPTVLPTKSPNVSPTMSPIQSCVNFIVSRSACDEFTDVDVLFIVDSSSSIEESEYEEYKNWLAYSIPRSVPPDSNVAVIQFATSQSMEFNFYIYNTIAEWEQKISSMEHLGGATWTKAAFQYALDNIWRNSDPRRQRVQVVITDGVWSKNQDPCDLYPNLIDMGVDTVFVGDINVINEISCIEDPNMYFVLLNLETDVGSDTSQYSTLALRKAFCPESTPFDGGYSTLPDILQNGKPVYLHTQKFFSSYDGFMWSFSHPEIGEMVEVAPSFENHPVDRRNWIFTDVRSGNTTYYDDVRIFCQNTQIPTFEPTTRPTTSPTSKPTTSPTSKPTTKPSTSPSSPPTTSPTTAPSGRPTTTTPTTSPTTQPTGEPSTSPTSHPTTSPTSGPTNRPTTTSPTTAPTTQPSEFPSFAPSVLPTIAPTRPTTSPVCAPTYGPSRTPSAAPTAPTTAPTSKPTISPTTSPTTSPTSGPTTSPSSNPTTSPTTQPSGKPTGTPTTSAPTTSPTTGPSVAPTYAPTASPTFCDEHVSELMLQVEQLTSINDFLSTSIETTACYNDEITMMKVNALIFPATEGLNCTGIFQDPSSSWYDVQDVHGYESICDAPIIATAVQYANEDQYDFVMEEILNITQGSETMIKQKQIKHICEATCDFCDKVSENYQIQEIIDGWAECEATLIEYENNNVGLTGCTSTYEPLGCTDFNPEIISMKEEIKELENEVERYRNMVTLQTDVQNLNTELSRIMSDFINWQTAVTAGHLNCVYVPKLYCEAITACTYNSSSRLCENK